MRKKRKGKRGSRAAKKPHPKPIAKEKPFARKYCFHCEERPARVLIPDGGKNPHKFFCSKVCATQCAVLCMLNSSIHWCAQHEMWSEGDGYCILCKIEDSIHIEHADLIYRGGCLEGKEAAHV